ncbi:hypothetical protein [Chlorobium phaeovibrioides]|uniref:Rod shape-determining protein MreD n=2 Tax=Chlorobium phaeovibrioides TaxID=1094 RepID=A0A5M8IEM6_CHLPH|nr:hypothetical protein [Chlorobium phaeovibrioides]KAA6232862.1 rod shape-determining protein MreD [Chlorobium phaeovibrioides]MWV54031.1 rod shape-determining protein MreD [Chlorobium phaeovibrioides]HCD36971.1 rod shape-determining protein MreD [Chlorobium sp.]
MKATTFRIAALLVPVTLMQVFLMPNLSILHVSPDALAVLVGFTAISAGRNTSMLTGFIGGMLMGILTGQMGLLMLAGTIGGFMAALFQIPEECHATQSLKTRRFFLASTLCSFTSSTIMTAGLNPLALSPAYRIAVLGGIGAILTLLLAIAARFLFMKKSFAD